MLSLVHAFTPVFLREGEGEREREGKKSGALSQ